jgi:uncharacterized protein
MPLCIRRTCRPAGLLIAPHLVARAWVATTAWSRFVGLLGTPDLQHDEALVLVPCAAVHAVGMRVAIGAAFLDAHGRVLRVVDPLPRAGARVRGAHAVVEARAGVLPAVRPGMVMGLTAGTLFPHRGKFAARSGGSSRAPRALTGHRGRGVPRDDRSMR